MARQYVRSVVSSVQRVAMAIAPSRLNTHLGPKQLPGSPEALTLSRWICRSYRSPNYCFIILLSEILRSISPVFTFANQAGLDMLETTLVALQDIMLDKVLDEAGRKVLLSEFSKIMQQGFAYLPAGICVSSMGRPISYDQAIAWKVLTDDNSSHCLAFMFLNWSFV
ncbi:Homeobox-leucine zipper protein hox32 [Heracleum sosnowskyi]|uniref:Homeobox-leucine zipper protein hox32 n=1 Tax=Heracleum sosnowskyi TaxID=360622 RepID=A0AAD8HEG4_9APIA|nr:Homeobox-leucine zipper protein hox32 [Heracleum sosnowskyi]